MRRISKTSFTPRKPFPSASNIRCTNYGGDVKFLTPKEIAQANVAKWLLHMLGYPLVVNLKTLIKTNIIQDNLVTKSNLKLMEHLFGPDIPTTRRKTTKQCPHQLVSNVVSIPHELCDAQHDVCLYIDIIYFNGMHFLTARTKNIKYFTTMWVADHTAPTMYLWLNPY